MSFDLTSGASRAALNQSMSCDYRLLRRLRGRHQPEPDVGFEIPVAGFRNRGQIRHRLDPLQRHGGEGTHLACSHLLADLRPVQHGGGHVRAEQRIHGRRAARIRHVGQIGLGQPLEPLDADVLGGVGPDAGDRQLGRLGACRVHELRKRAIGRRGIDDDELRRRDQIADRLEARQRIVVHLAQDRADDDAVVVDQQRVAVRRRARHRLGRDDAAGARPALDDDRLAFRAGDVIRQDADQKVDAAPGRNRDDDADRSAGLRPCGMIGHRGGQTRQCKSAGRKGEKLPHLRLLGLSASDASLFASPQPYGIARCRRPTPWSTARRIAKRRRRSTGTIAGRTCNCLDNPPARPSRPCTAHRQRRAIAIAPSSVACPVTASSAWWHPLAARAPCHHTSHRCIRRDFFHIHFVASRMRLPAAHRESRGMETPPVISSAASRAATTGRR